MKRNKYFKKTTLFGYANFDIASKESMSYIGFRDTYIFERYKKNVEPEHNASVLKVKITIEPIC